MLKRFRDLKELKLIIGEIWKNEDQDYRLVSDIRRVLSSVSREPSPS